MKATPLTTSFAALALFTFPALADHAKKHDAHHAHAARSRAPTAMHTTQVHQKDASVTVAQPPIAVHVAAHAAGHAQPAQHVAIVPKKPCLHEAVSIARGTEEDHFALTRCDGTPLPEAIDHLSVLARADNVMRAHGNVLPAGTRRIDGKLVERLQQVADHFATRGHAVAMHIISGYRPNSVGSYHASAQALDLRVDNVRNEELVSFCKTLQDTGCGYYPNSSFVHIDVRAPGTGHVAWIDASGPGESPHYVSAWPAPPDLAKDDLLAKIAQVLPPIPVDEHPADVKQQMLEAQVQAEQHATASVDKPSRVH